MWQFFHNLRWQDGVDILLVAVLIYQVVVFLRGTQAQQVLVGLFLLFLGYVAARGLELYTLEWLLDGVVRSFLLIVIILFQADLRRALSRMGRRALAPPSSGSEADTLEEISDAAENLSEKHMGALIVLERSASLADYLDSAIKMDAIVTKELLVSLFWPHNPTHDGAAIIQGDRLAGAGVVLPLTKKTDLDPALGTRHRAALGLSEQTDALVLVVSETTGAISLAQGGKMQRRLTRLQLRQALQAQAETPATRKGNWFDRLVRFFGT
jgi:diadenylate cyclase